MNSILQLVKFGKTTSHSALVDFQQIHLRNAIFFCTGLSMARLLFGENIECQTAGAGLSPNYIDTKCYINGTMTINGNQKIYHDYYQWVSIFLLLLAFGFYFPYSVWSKIFGSYIRHLEHLADKPDEAIQVIKESKGNLIYFKTWGLEFFYFAYMIVILCLTDKFFNHLWSDSGWSLDAIPIIFPDNGTCYITYFQSAGSSDGWLHCLLPLCSIYRKVFAVLYGFIIMLFIMNSLMLMYRIKIICQRKRMVNVWWAFMIVKRSSVSWNAQTKYDCALQKLLELPTGNLISLNVMPNMERYV